MSISWEDRAVDEDQKEARQSAKMIIMRWLAEHPRGQRILIGDGIFEVLFPPGSEQPIEEQIAAFCWECGGIQYHYDPTEGLEVWLKRAGE